MWQHLLAWKLHMRTDFPRQPNPRTATVLSHPHQSPVAFKCQITQGSFPCHESRSGSRQIGPPITPPSASDTDKTTDRTASRRGEHWNGSLVCRCMCVCMLKRLRKPIFFCSHSTVLPALLWPLIEFLIRWFIVLFTNVYMCRSPALQRHLPFTLMAGDEALAFNFWFLV